MFSSVFCMQAKHKLTGVMNYTNPGAISHNEVRMQHGDAAGWRSSCMQLCSSMRGAFVHDYVTSAASLHARRWSYDWCKPSACADKLHASYTRCIVSCQ